MEQRSPMSFLSSTAAIEDALLSEDMLLEILSHMTPLTKALFSLTCKYLYLKWKDEEKEEFRGSDMAERIAGEGNVDMLRWAIEDLHSPITSDAANEAASHDNLANLKYLKSKNCPMYRSMVECALSSGSMAVLQWMHSVDYKWIASLPARTLCSPQHLRVILFLIQFGYLKTISKEFVSEAAEKGHLDKLRWAVQNRVLFTSLHARTFLVLFLMIFSILGGIGCNRCRKQSGSWGTSRGLAASGLFEGPHTSCQCPRFRRLQKPIPHSQISYRRERRRGEELPHDDSDQEEQRAHGRIPVDPWW